MLPRDYFPSPECSSYGRHCGLTTRDSCSPSFRWRVCWKSSVSALAMQRLSMGPPCCGNIWLVRRFCSLSSRHLCHLSIASRFPHKAIFVHAHLCGLKLANPTPSLLWFFGFFWCIFGSGVHLLSLCVNTWRCTTLKYLWKLSCLWWAFWNFVRKSYLRRLCTSFTIVCSAAGISCRIDSFWFNFTSALDVFSCLTNRWSWI